MAKHLPIIGLTWLLLAGAALGQNAQPESPDVLAAKPEAIKAWQDMRFGMFICWGPVSLTGKEIGWSRGAPTPIDEYDNLYKKWNPDKFDAREWIRVVKESGARYIVFLLKHHDGFCLWDTKQTDYNIMNGPFKRDVVKEIAAACREQGIGFFHLKFKPVTAQRVRLVVLETTTNPLVGEVQLFKAASPGAERSERR